MWVSKRKWNALEQRISIVESKLQCRKYEVQKGDSLLFIADRHCGCGMKYEDIARINNMAVDAPLFPGQIIWIPDK